MNGQASEIGGGRGRGFWKGCAAGGEKWSRGMQIGYAAGNGRRKRGGGDCTARISMANRGSILSGSIRLLLSGAHWLSRTHRARLAAQNHGIRFQNTQRVSPRAQASPASPRIAARDTICLREIDFVFFQWTFPIYHVVRVWIRARAQPVQRRTQDLPLPCMCQLLLLA